MQRFFSRWVGYTTSKVPTTPLRTRLLSTWRNRLIQVCTNHSESVTICLRPLDQTDAQSWYLLGRCYMSQHKFPKAYEAYQQAVYRDGRNPTFWCSIGVLYYQINQYRDALDAYSRAIRLNPNISEVWYDLGTLVGHIELVSINHSLTITSTNPATIRQAMH